jgi:predicted ferric reductase
MKRALAGIFWLLLYVAIVLGALGLMRLPPQPAADRPFLIDLAIALGFLGLMQIALQFLLIARFPSITSPYGIDVIMEYHREIGFLAFGMVLLHPVLLLAAQPSWLGLLNPFGGTWASRSGVISLAALALLIGLSIFRSTLRLNYEVWRVMHFALGAAAIVAGALHVLLVGEYVNWYWKQGLWIAVALLALGELAYLRLIKPLGQRRVSYRVVEVRKERGRTWSLIVEPVGHAGMAFEPGQFAWLKVGRNPLTIEEHPFSFSSSAESPAHLEFAIKEQGDFTGAIGALPPGTRVFLDGPHGALSIDQHPAAAYVMIAGGIGIAPMMSMLRTMADRQDQRPVRLLYGNRAWDSVAFREELESLRGRLRLEVVHVLKEPPPPDAWKGETGVFTTDLLKRCLPRDRLTRVIFVCGPNAMIDAVDASLREIGVPDAVIVAERFELV